jgi:hypothetical protein
MPKKSVQLSGVVVAESAISSIDPDEGVLMYRGYDIGDLAERSTYEETALLLLDGDAPSAAALDAFSSELAAQRELPAATAEAIDRQASSAAPMEVLRTAVSTLSRATPVQLIAQLPTMVARYHRRRRCCLRRRWCCCSRRRWCCCSRRRWCCCSCRRRCHSFHPARWCRPCRSPTRRYQPSRRSR